MKWIFGLFILAVVGLMAGSLFLGEHDGKGTSVNVVGSTSIQPFAEMLSQEFNAAHPGRNVEVQGGGSTAGLQAASEGIADIGMCSRGLKDAEKEKFTPVVIARDGLAIVVHTSNPVSALTREQIRMLFSGEITNWKDVGGADRPVRVITREEGSGTREAFMKMVMEHHAKDAKSAPGEVVHIDRKALTQESNGAVKELVRSDPCAIGYMSLGLVGQELKVITVDGVHPSVQEVSNGKYPLVRPFLFVTKGRPSAGAQAFIEFVLSEKGQKMLAKEGLVNAS